MTHPSPMRRGVTLIELMLVMVMLAVFAAVLVPRFSDFFPSLQVNQSARTLLAWAKKARADAALMGTRQRLIFDFEKRKYWIEYQNDPLRKAENFQRHAGAWDEEGYPESVTFQAIEGLTTENNVTYLEFHPDGTSQDTVILISNEQGDQQLLTVVGATSRIEVEDAEALEP